MDAGPGGRLARPLRAPLHRRDAGAARHRRHPDRAAGRRSAPLRRPDGRPRRVPRAFHPRRPRAGAGPPGVDGARRPAPGGDVGDARGRTGGPLPRRLSDHRRAGPSVSARGELRAGRIRRRRGARGVAGFTRQRPLLPARRPRDPPRPRRSRAGRARCAGDRSVRRPLRRRAGPGHPRGRPARHPGHQHRRDVADGAGRRHRRRHRPPQGRALRRRTRPGHARHRARVAGQRRPAGRPRRAPRPGPGPPPVGRPRSAAPARRAGHRPYRSRRAAARSRGVGRRPRHLPVVRGAAARCGRRRARAAAATRLARRRRAHAARPRHAGAAAAAAPGPDPDRSGRRARRGAGLRHPV